ncbi:hypothetical protein JCM8202_000504 [Rhodotorula sphaerocarpa]
MARIVLPVADVAPTENAYAYFATWLQAQFEADPTAGFKARLIVLWTLTGYGIVVACSYLLLLGYESRRTQRKLWFWRWVTRSSGNYLIGNPRSLFAVMTFISCGLMIGYFLSFDRAYLKDADRSNVFFWRSIIWIPIGEHLWISSWANLQASIISSQTAAGRQVVGPKLSNLTYLGGIAAGFCTILGLAIACAVLWQKTWQAQETLEYTLLGLASLRPNDSPAEAQAQVASLVTALNRKLGPFLSVLQSDNALCAAGAALIIVANFGGLALLISLHRQIKFHIVDAIATPGSRIGSLAQVIDGPDLTRTRATDLTAADHQLPERDHASLKAGSSVPVNSALRQKAARLLELRKVEHDVIALLSVIVVLASVCLAIGLWLAIAPTSVYSRWTTIEVAYMLVPWMYLVSVDTTLTYLLVNALRHLVPLHRFAPAQARTDQPGSFEKDSHMAPLSIRKGSQDCSIRPSEEDMRAGVEDSRPSEEGKRQSEEDTRLAEEAELTGDEDRRPTLEASLGHQNSYDSEGDVIASLPILTG